MRYFFFSYTAQSSTQTADGNVFLARGEMPSSNEISAIAESRNPGMSAVVTNIFEFKSEADFNSFAT